MLGLRNAPGVRYVEVWIGNDYALNPNGVVAHGRLEYVVTVSLSALRSK